MVFKQSLVALHVCEEGFGRKGFGVKCTQSSSFFLAFDKASFAVAYTIDFPIITNLNNHLDLSLAL